MDRLESARKIAAAAVYANEERQWNGAPMEPYRTPQIFRFITDAASRERLMDTITFAADWFEHDNVMGRDPRGEADFEAIRLIPLYFTCYDALSGEAKEALERFFLRRDYSSIYGSENHALMYRVSRYLAAQFYLGSGKVFEQFDSLTPEEVYTTDGAWIREFLDYRAKRGWGEFDSCGYGAEIMLILSLLYAYTADDTMKRLAGMIMDVILLDMICDSKNGLYGGAHGRIYPPTALDTKNSGLFRIYNYYFGARFGMDSLSGVPTALLLSDYVPSDIVYAVESGRTYPYVNREMKHLHMCSVWSGKEIDHETLALVDDCFINKQTYVGERYLLGGVNHQDPYPDAAVNDKGYAHHQQHEWELTLPGDTTHKIFSHHPGDPGYHKIHNRWTGDYGCLCSTHYTNENTAISIYTITKPNEFPYINAYVPLDVFEEKRIDGKYLFLAYPGLYISLYFSSGYRVNNEDEYAGREILSDGRRHAVVLRVEYAEKFASLAAFAEAIKAIPVVYDPEARTVDFDGIHVYYHGNAEQGVENVYPYGMLYDSPWMKSVWRSGVIEITDGNQTAVYDFNRVEVR
ncbi:MAG: hypothetical protein IJ493_07930 [Clostridia bacterium]|nr:hypothetical protein [Clostridia bacterium]